MKRIRVLIVDDSAVARGIITTLLNLHTDIEVVGFCRDGRTVEASVEKLKPDVITLDVEMPHLNGPALLAQLNISLKTPVIMVSGVTTRGAQITLDCLALGAVDFVLKPSPKSESAYDRAISDYGQELVEKIRIAAQSSPQIAKPEAQDAGRSSVATPAMESSRIENATLIAIGASTGGPKAVAAILRELSPECPPIVVAIHMPMPFTLLYAERIAKLCKLKVVHAKNGETLKSGTVYIAPGDQHTKVIQRSQGNRAYPNYAIRLEKPNLSDLIKPNIDMLLTSVAVAAGSNALACILTGMGKDGAQGTLAIHKAGGVVFAQDENSSVIYGMPKAAKNEGHVDLQLPLDAFPEAIFQYLQQTQSKPHQKDET
jgi:two-component system, chemotaxis family, protein-glutamate methylesterase/glutaminase